jgi:hypothetical protein
MAKRDANDAAVELGQEGFKRETRLRADAAGRQAIKDAGFLSLEELLAKTHQKERDPIIHGLLRRGEVANVTADPKAGKSWLIHDMLLQVARGGYWLQPDFACSPGPVVVIDNELHEETLGWRLGLLADRHQLNGSVRRNLHVNCLRGRWLALEGQRRKDDEPRESIKNIVLPLKILKPRIVVFDALYRLMPQGMSENDNNAVAHIYNQIDELAEIVESAAFVVIHHNSRGGQGFKRVTDVGAGAGALTRAPDTHIVLREHEDDGHFVFEAVTRSWPRVQPFVVKWEFPRWVVDTNKDATRLRGAKIAKSQGPDELTAADIADYMEPGEEMSLKVLKERGNKRDDISCRRMEALWQDFQALHDLGDLTSADGKLDLGPIWIEKAGRGGGIKFIRKADVE